MNNKPMHPNQANVYLQHGDQEIARLAFSYLNLIGAVQAVYYGAQWIADREIDEEAMWKYLRDCAGFTPGMSPEITKVGIKLREVQQELFSKE